MLCTFIVAALLSQGAADNNCVVPTTRCSAPMAMMLVLDASGSMRGQGADVISFASCVISQVELGTVQMGVSKFNNNATLLQQLTSNEQDLIASLEGYSMGGITNIGAGMMLAAEQLLVHYNGMKRLIVILTDGEQSSEFGGSDEAIRISNVVKAQGITIFSLGLGSGFSTATTQALATPPVNVHALHGDNMAALIQQFASNFCSKLEESDAGGVASVTGDPHLTNIHGDKYSLWKQGWLNLLRLPNAPTGVVREFDMWAKITGNPNVQCQPGFITAVSFAGTWMRGKSLKVERDAPGQPVTFSVDGTSPTQLDGPELLAAMGAIGGEHWLEVRSGQDGGAGTIVISVSGIHIKVKLNHGRATSVNRMDILIDGLTKTINPGGLLGSDDPGAYAKVPARCH